MANSGWSDGTWGSSFWGGFQDLSFSITGVSGTTAVGTAQGLSTATPTPSGQSATGAVGSVVVSIPVDVAVTGVNATGKMTDGWGDGGYGLDAWGGTTTVELVQKPVVTSPRIQGIIGSRVSFTAQADAALSTSQSKFGGSSLALDGAGDRVQSTDITLGTDDYTWETFAYFNNFSSTQCIWDAGENVGASQNPVVYITSTNLQLSYAGGTYINAAHGMTAGGWHHIAIVRDSNQLEAFIDGVSIGTATYAGGSGATNHVLGGNFAGTFTMDGFLDESRLTKRVIYTGNFTPPTQAFTADAADEWLLHYDGSDGSTDIDNSAPGDNGLTITGTSIVDVTGPGMTASLGTALAGAGAIVTETGLQGDIGFGDESVVGDANVYPAGLGANGILGGGYFVFSTLSITLTGLEATTTLNNSGITVIQSQLIIPSPVTGTGFIGATMETGDANVTLTGVSVSGNIGNVLIWQNIAPTVTTTWNEVAA